ncbi:hypothetical protein WA158_001933 [Blastocystis sp. Blastoise]
MCVNCIRAKVDITEGISRQVIMQQCRGCERYYRPPWTTAARDSKELMALCLKKMKGLKFVKLIDAEFVWTEPHSRRIKIKITIQKEVFKVILQQSFIVVFILQNKTCEDCIMEVIEHKVKAVVQIRQKVEHKRTFYFLEQLILKNNIHRKASRIEQQPDGLDFSFAERSDARTFLNFLKEVVPMTFTEARQLLSQDFSSNVTTYKYCYMVNILPICKDDLCALPKKTAQELGMNPLCLCYKVNNCIGLIDPTTCTVKQLSVERFQANPFRSLLNNRMLTEYTVIDIDLVEPEDNHPIKRKYALADVTVARSRDIGINDIQFTVKTHLGYILKAGDTVLGYDLTVAIYNDDDAKSLESKDIPYCVLVRKSYPLYRKSHVERNWELQKLQIEESDTLAARKKKDKSRAEVDYEMFLRDLEEDKDLRSQINVYKKSDKPIQINDEVEEDAPVIPLEELLDNMTISDIPPEDEVDMNEDNENNNEDDDIDMNTNNNITIVH